MIFGKAKKDEYFLMCMRAYEIQDLQPSVMGTLLKATGNKGWVWMPKRQELHKIAKLLFCDAYPKIKAEIDEKISCPNFLALIMDKKYDKRWSDRGKGWVHKDVKESSVPEYVAPAKTKKFKYDKTIFED